VRQHARDLVGILRLRQQPFQQIDLAARSAKALGTHVDSTPDCTDRIEIGGFADRRDELGKRLLPGHIVAELGVEYRLDLPVGDIAEPPFERIQAPAVSDVRRRAERQNSTTATIETRGASDQRRWSQHRGGRACCRR